MSPDDSSVTDDSTPPTVTVTDATGGAVAVDAEALQKLPPEKRKAALRLIQESSFSGPIPPPDLLAGYEATLPGAMDRIIRMAESAQAHSQRMDSRAQTFTFIESMAGVSAALIIALVAIGGGLYALMNGATGAGLFITGVGLGPLIGAFLYKYRKSKDEDARGGDQPAKK